MTGVNLFLEKNIRLCKEKIIKFRALLEYKTYLLKQITNIVHLKIMLLILQSVHER